MMECGRSNALSVARFLIEVGLGRGQDDD